MIFLKPAFISEDQESGALGPDLNSHSGILFGPVISFSYALVSWRRNQSARIDIRVYGASIMCSALSENPEKTWVISWDSIPHWPLEKGRLDNAQDLYASFISMLALIFLSQL